MLTQLHYHKYIDYFFLHLGKKSPTLVICMYGKIGEDKKRLKVGILTTDIFTRRTERGRICGPKIATLTSFQRPSSALATFPRSFLLPLKIYLMCWHCHMLQQSRFFLHIFYEQNAHLKHLGGHCLYAIQIINKYKMLIIMSEQIRRVIGMGDSTFIDRLVISYQILHFSGEKGFSNQN